jgi:hypothetical protein
LRKNIFISSVHLLRTIGCTNDGLSRVFVHQGPRFCKGWNGHIRTAPFDAIDGAQNNSQWQNEDLPTNSNYLSNLLSQYCIVGNSVKLRLRKYTCKWANIKLQKYPQPIPFLVSDLYSLVVDKSIFLWLSKEICFRGKFRDKIEENSRITNEFIRSNWKIMQKIGVYIRNLLAVR